MTSEALMTRYSMIPAPPVKTRARPSVSGESRPDDGTPAARLSRYYGTREKTCCKLHTHDARHHNLGSLRVLEQRWFTVAGRKKVPVGHVGEDGGEVSLRLD